MAFKDNNGPKQKAFSYEKCFNCHELGHFRRNCPHPNKRQTNLQVRNNLQP